MQIAAIEILNILHCDIFEASQFSMRLSSGLILAGEASLVGNFPCHIRSVQTIGSGRTVKSGGRPAQRGGWTERQRFYDVIGP